MGLDRPTNLVQLSVMRNNVAWLGNAPIVVPDLRVGNGIIHILSAFPTGDIGMNETAVLTASKLADFGPFNASQVRSEPESMLLAASLSLQVW